MTCLIDVNVLLAAIWVEHPHHARVASWLEQNRVAVCPLTELGFIRVSTNPKFKFRATMDKTRELLKKFLRERNAARLPDDLPALESNPEKSDDVTDSYLAALAERYKMKLATLDENISHPAVTVI